MTSSSYLARLAEDPDKYYQLLSRVMRIHSAWMDYCRVNKLDMKAEDFWKCRRKEITRAITEIRLLTAREMEILSLVVDGDDRSYQEVADRLGISRNTVKWHLRNIYSKLHASNRVQAFRRAARLYLIRLEYPITT